MSNISLFLFNCLTSNFCFPKIISFASRGERKALLAKPDPNANYFYLTLGELSKKLKRKQTLPCASFNQFV